MAQEEITGTEISEFPEASTIYGGDVVAGVQSGSNKKFSFATIFAWIKSKLSAAEISYDSETSGSSADNVQDAITELATTRIPFWFGTRQEYNNLPSIDPDVCYCIEEGT